ncbi:hypothetical protein ACA910_021871 [Epithemia clementina (nom. ined.)]
MNSRFFRRVQDFLGRNGGNADTPPPGAAATNGGAPQQDRNIHMEFDEMLNNIFGGGLNAFTDSFDAATRAAMEASWREAQQQGGQRGGGGGSGGPSRGPPPASDRAIRDLPLIRIRTEDLVDPVNRECCVCLDGHQLADTAVRLPCAHIFHKDCILDWLKTHCTCPVCRYELPTDDPSFERQRVQRMRNRKPRFARHELERLSIKELKRLLPPRDNYHAVDRSDLVDHLINVEAIDLVASPDPVEYSMTALRQMTISQLKRCMNEEGGVFFDPKEVVEKDDMIRIFLGSGRLKLLPDDDSEIKNEEDDDNDERGQPESTMTNDAAEILEGSTLHSTSSQQPIVETVVDSEGLTSPLLDLRTNTDLVMEECTTPDSTERTANTFNDETPISATAEILEQSTVAEDELEIPSAESENINPPLDSDQTHVEDDLENVPIDPEDITASQRGAGSSDVATNKDDADELSEPSEKTDMPVDNTAAAGTSTYCDEHESTQEETPQFSTGNGNPSSEMMENDTTEPIDTINSESEVMENDTASPIDTNNSESEVMENDTAEPFDTSESWAKENDSAEPVDTNIREVLGFKSEETMPTSDSSARLSDQVDKDQEQTAISDGGDRLGAGVASDQSSSDADASEESNRPSRKRSLPNSPPTKVPPGPLVSPFDGLSVSELRRRADQMSVDISACIERQEMIDELSRHSDDSERTCSQLFADLTTSELLMLATLIDMNGTMSGDRDDMIKGLQREVKERPQIASFVKSLGPFVRLTVPQLRAVARERCVDVRDCLEKTDILRRLVDSKGGGRDGF